MNLKQNLTPERSPDIEWLLQSGEASQRTIATFLVREYYLPLLRLGYALVEDPYAARGLAQETLAVALLQGQRYSGEVSVLGWLDAILLRLYRLSARGEPLTSHASRPSTDPGWEAWTKLDPALRAAFALRALHNLPDAEIAQAFGPSVDENEAAERVAAAQETLSNEAGSVSFDSGTAIEARLAAAGLGREDPREVVEQILPLSDQERERRKRADATRQGFMVVLALALVLGMLSAANRWLPTTPKPTPVVQTVVVNQVVQVTATPGPTPTPYPALNAHSSAEEALRKANAAASTWSSAWADALVLDYGPSSYLGPPRLYRNQVWYRQPEDALVLGGSLEEGPNYLRAMHAWQAFDFNPRAEGGALLSGMPDNPFQFNLRMNALEAPRLNGPLTQLSGYYLDGLIRPNLVLEQDGELRAAGIERQVGREALRLDWLPADGQAETRLWIDTQSGLVLRAQYLKASPSGTPTVTAEIILTDLQLNVDFPQDFFTLDGERYAGLAWGDLWQPAPAQDPQVPAEPPPGREPLPHAPAPAGFDPAGEALTFQWSRDAQNPNLPGSSAELFAGGYALGQVELGSPWSFLCKRSPDGSILTFARGSSTYWLDLRAPDKVYDLFEDGDPRLDNVEEFRKIAVAYAVFSPDSRSLAFANCAPNEPCALIVQNLETRQNRVLALKDERASYQLTQWSADGRYLRVGKFTRSAAIATAEIVLEVATGRVVYEGNAINIAPETIDIEWNEGQFGYSIGLEGCSLAP